MENIKFEYEGASYTLCYTRDSARQIEAQGFSINEVDSKAHIMIPLLFRGAFIARHKNIKRKITDEIWKHIKSPEIISTLLEMYSDTLNDLLEGDEEDPKRITWSKE